MITIYLSGGMKGSWQDQLLTLPVVVIDPRTRGLTEERDYTEWDLAGIRASDLVIAYMDSDNPSGFGLSLEVGYARALDIPIWYVCEDTTSRQRFFGMVRACSSRVFNSLTVAVDELKGML
jgi:nucleoside 2-deoxyribosyltransferase